MLRRVLRWLGIGLATILVFALAALAYAYVASTRIIGRTYDVPLTALEATADSALLADGPRLVSLWGCLGGCHGEEGTGTVMFEEPLIGSIRAPNITTILPDYTNEELERLIRRGVKRDGRSVFVMPSRFLYQLDDARLGSMITYLRSLPRQENRFEGGVKFGPMGRVFLALGEFRPSAAEVDPDSPRRYPDPMDEKGLGEFWATTVCVECHGEDLRGEDDFSPSLEVVAAAYTYADFELLLRTGIALGGREVGLMSEVARDNFRHLTASEIAGLYGYLTGHFAADSAADSAADE